MTILAFLYTYITYMTDGPGNKVLPALLLAPFIDIVLIMAWFVSVA